jgi:low affinity Fe/Cu permease
MPVTDERDPRWFDRFASRWARRTGSPLAFLLSVAFTLVWLVTGPLFGFSDTWQLVINTATTVLTFLMVFVIQNTINRDSAAVHLKLDELLRVTAAARDRLVGAERLGEDQIEALHETIERQVEREVEEEVEEQVGERRAGAT